MRGINCAAVFLAVFSARSPAVVAARGPEEVEVQQIIEALRQSGVVARWQQDEAGRRGLEIEFHFPDVTDEQLAPLERLRDVRSLLVRSRKLTDRGLAHISGCSELQSLSLECPQLSDRGLETLKNFRELRVLRLEAATEGACLKHLEGAGRLWSVSLISPRLNRDGIKNLSRLSGLTNLQLIAPLDDAGVEELAALGELRGLSLNSPDLTNEHLAKLRPLTNLRTLHLAGTRVTDLKNLPSLNRLISLQCENVPLTDAGLGGLKAIPFN